MQYCLIVGALIPFNLYRSDAWRLCQNDDVPVANSFITKTPKGKLTHLREDLL